jgi:acetate kinase
VQILALNGGSSSLKYGIYALTAGREEVLLDGEIELEGAAGAHADTLARVVDALDGAGLSSPDAVGHRVVHGGPQVRAHRVIDDAVMDALRAACTFAPLHMPATMTLIDHARRAFPGCPHVACIDTAFHAGLPDVARVLPLPRGVEAEGILRYGFHGLSCESIVHQLAPSVPGRLVIAHLGSGASVTAVREGRSVDTSMGLTPAGGVVMRTRTGDIDPGVLLHLMRTRRLDVDAVERLVNSESGLLGIGGGEGDMRELHARAAHDANARLAIAMFCQSVTKTVAGMFAVLGGVDALVFTGGIGEHDAIVRARVRAGLGWAGVGAEESAPTAVTVHVMPSQEDLQIARVVVAALGAGGERSWTS